MSDRQIIESIQKLSGSQLTDQVYFLACEVLSVDKPARTCACRSIDGARDFEFPNVRLMADVDDGFLLVPEIGSTVFVTYSRRNDPIIVLFSAIKEVLLISGDTSFSLTADGIVLNDGSFGGLIKIEKLVEKINNLENLVNDLIAKFNSHTHVLTLSTGTGTAAPTATPETNQLSPTKRSELENDQIKHGKKS